MIVFDIETDGLLDDLTKIHVMSWTTDGKTYHSTHDYNVMKHVLMAHDTLVGHYIIGFDVPAVEKVLGIDLSSKTLIDTLALSWYINHSRDKHGLEGYGELYGIPKPEVKDWKNLTPEEYAHRCTEDVKINWRLYKDLTYKLDKIYMNDQETIDRLIRYLSFKMKCVADQENIGWKLDVDRCQKEYDNLIELKSIKEKQLISVMPKRIIYKVVNRPKTIYKKDGSYTISWIKWEEICKANNYPNTYESIRVIDKEEDGNPNSSDQVKDWLYSLGWVPKTFKFTRGSDGSEKNIPQIRKDGELCESVLELCEDNPDVNYLNGLTVLQHRSAILKSFLDSHKDGYLKATVAGFTNTLRFRHSKPLVNLPGVDKPYGDIIRGVLTCGDGELLVGSDMTSLEDTTKRHYIQPLDPDYVAEMQKPGFDPHLDLSVFAGAITREDYHRYAELDKADTMSSEDRAWYKSLKKIRKSYKVVNYSATYGVGASKLARETGLSLSEAKALLDAFWGRNWAIRKLASSMRVREVHGSMWVLNPVSGFWYSLRSEKDIFSTLNQGTGVYCFDNWVAIVKAKGVPMVGQFHDEWIGLIGDDVVETTKEHVSDSIIQLNNKLNLNVPLGCDVQFGKTYADIH